MIDTPEAAREFAERWADSWNRRDLESVLEHFADDVVFISPTALALLGDGTVRGKAALRAYWAAALSRIASLHFAVDRVIWDPRRRELAIIYTSTIDGKTKRVSENLRFNRTGQVSAGEVFHGVTAAVPRTTSGGA
jgi:ketosteroid isomerase-like protein